MRLSWQILLNRHSSFLAGQSPSGACSVHLFRMPQITLSRSQVESLVAFCDAAKSEKFFIAKDHGAYVGYSTGPKPE